MNKDIASYLRWLNGMINDEDERKEMKIEKFADGGATVKNADGDVLLEASKQGDTWKVLGDNGLYDEEYPMSTRENWTPEQSAAYQQVERVLHQL